MPVISQRMRVFYGLLLAVLLVLGQNAAAYHPADHDDGVDRNAACAACAVINLLSSGCVDTTLVVVPRLFSTRIVATRSVPPVSLEVLAPRQRAPPRA